jgi:hypothetical protein
MNENFVVLKSSPTSTHPQTTVKSLSDLCVCALPVLCYRSPRYRILLGCLARSLLPALALLLRAVDDCTRKTVNACGQTQMEMASVLFPNRDFFSSN